MTEVGAAWLAWCLTGLIVAIILSARTERNPGKAAIARAQLEPESVWVNIAYIAAALVLWPVMIYGYILGENK